MEGSDLAALWSWCCDVARSARADTPLTIHSQSGERSEWGKADDAAIRALPFSKPFLRHVDHELPSPIRTALEAVKPLRSDPGTSHATKAARRSMYRVVEAVVRHGETDMEACRSRLAMSEFTFIVAASNGIRAFRSALERA